MVPMLSKRSGEIFARLLLLGALAVLCGLSGASRCLGADLPPPQVEVSDNDVLVKPAAEIAPAPEPVAEPVVTPVQEQRHSHEPVQQVNKEPIQNPAVQNQATQKATPVQYYRQSTSYGERRLFQRRRGGRVRGALSGFCGLFGCG